MKFGIKIIIFLAVIALISISSTYFYYKYFKVTTKDTPSSVNNNMKLISPAFFYNEPISTKYTCDGENINPPLLISGVPDKAKSLALIVDDPDAPGGNFVHWLIWNIKPDTAEIRESSFPKDSIQGTNGAGSNKYFGPCPPAGPHHYHFTLYALDTLLNLEPRALILDLTEAMKNHIIEQVLYIGTYQRQ